MSRAAVSVKPDWFVSVEVWPFVCATRISWQVPKQPHFLLVDRHFPLAAPWDSVDTSCRPGAHPSGERFPLLPDPVPSRSPWHEKSLVSAGLCGARSRFWLPTVTPALFSESGLNAETFTGAKGPWKTSSCFQTLLQSLPRSSGDEGSSRIQALLNISGKVGTESSNFWSHYVLPTLQWLKLPYFVQW